VFHFKPPCLTIRTINVESRGKSRLCDGKVITPGHDKVKARFTLGVQRTNVSFLKQLLEPRGNPAGRYPIEMQLPDHSYYFPIINAKKIHSVQVKSV